MSRECEHHCDINEKSLNELKKTLIDSDSVIELSVLFKMYADPSRLKILNCLFKKELCVCDIAYLCDMSHSAISHQLAKLKANRIIKSRKDGKNVYYSLDDEHIEMIFNNGLSHIEE